MIVYLKQKEKIVKLDNDIDVTLNDLCEIICDDEKLGNITILKLNKNQFKRYVVTNIHITKMILEQNKDYEIVAMGMQETIVDYKKKKKTHTILDVLKVIAVCIVIFAGASTTIMSFHNETEIPSVFDQYYKMFFGYESNKNLIIGIPYSFGLSLGIILFFNHIFGKKITDSPTPIEVEMTKYESDLAKTEAKIEENRIRLNKEKGEN